MSMRSADVHKVIQKSASAAKNRLDLWSRIINEGHLTSCAEIGVFRGAFAKHLLSNCPSIETYYMLDPWRHLDDWNKPSNTTDDEFDRIKAEALDKTRFAEGRRRVLQGTTTEVSEGLPAEGLDFAYIDGDHTLKGITIDLLKIWPKVKHGGILAGDDFCPSVWQHGLEFEPTLVFPLAVYFSQAMGCTIYGLPYDQFAIHVDRSGKNAFEFRDLTGQYKSTTVRDALRSSRLRSARKRLGTLKRAIVRKLSG